ncbi:MAG: diaminopimelate decarboxylase [Elusimicrobia bacterium]|nr:diaminopimelate decarboxylase [Elusimicrobiota bacterium]
MLNYRKGNLFIENVSFESLAKKFGTPLYVYSRAGLINNFTVFDDALSSVPHIVCYAVKANSNFSILKVLSKNGAGADITSGGELYRSLRAGFPSKKIVYAGIGKTREEISYALRENILIFNVESLEELSSINEVATRLKKKAKIAFRINPNVDPDTHHYITTGKKGGKFGIPYSQAISAYKMAKKMSSISVEGIHCHIGSQIVEAAPFKLAAQRINVLFEKLSNIGIHLNYINLGGGLGIRYDRENPPTPYDLTKAVIPIFKNFSGTFIFEPGRYIVGNAGFLLVKVIYRKQSGGKNFLIVDGGMNDLIRPTLYDAYHEIIPVKKSLQPKIKVDVVGPICETGDFLGKERLLPWVPQDGLLVVNCAGAYGYAMSSQTEKILLHLMI